MAYIVQNADQRIIGAQSWSLAMKRVEQLGEVVQRTIARRLQQHPVPPQPLHTNVQPRDEPCRWRPIGKFGGRGTQVGTHVSTHA